MCVSLLVLSTPKRALLQPELVCSRADDRVNPFSHLTNRARVECGGNRRYLHPDAISKRRHLPAASKQGALNQGAGRQELVVARWEDEMGRGLARTDGRLISLGNSSGQSRLLSFAGSIRSSGLGRCSLLHSAHTHTVIPSFSPFAGQFYAVRWIKLKAPLHFLRFPLARKRPQCAGSCVQQPCNPFRRAIVWTASRLFFFS